MARKSNNLSRAVKKPVFRADRELYRSSENIGRFPWIREEYQRLRSLANKRIKRLEVAGYSDTETVREFKGAFPSSRGMTNEDIADIMPELSYFLDLQISTVKGMRTYIDKQLQSLHDSGYDFVNKQNFQQWAQFMDQMKEYFTDAYIYEEMIVEAKGQSTMGEIRRRKAEIVQRKFSEWQKVGGYK